MKSKFLIVLAIFALGCKKHKESNPDTGEQFTTSTGKQYGLSIRDNMLYFEDADLYDQLVSKPEEEIMAVLKPFEKTDLFTSLVEKRGYSWKTGDDYTPLIATLLNEDHMIAIEGKIFRINAKKDRVLAINAKEKTTKLISELASENTSNKAIEVHSVDEDLPSLLERPIAKYGPGGGCPNTGQNLTNIAYSDFTSANSVCVPYNSTIRIYSIVHYKRYGVLFELYAEGYTSPYCTTVTGYCYKLSYRGNKTGWSQYTNNNFAFTLNSNKLYKFYSASYRLCNFHALCSMKTMNAIYEVESSQSGVSFNFTTWP
ncbi:hypothetical protein D3C87_196810 [compost metagenome]